jgi:coproporphyrinogen III oxidase
MNFGRQPRFHDLIIRDAASFASIENYIMNNVKNWKDDKFYLQERDESVFLFLQSPQVPGIFMIYKPMCTISCFLQLAT